MVDGIVLVLGLLFKSSSVWSCVICYRELRAVQHSWQLHVYLASYTMITVTVCVCVYGVRVSCRQSIGSLYGLNALYERLELVSLSTSQPKL